MECGGGSHPLSGRVLPESHLGKRRLIVAALQKVVWSAVAEATAFWSRSTGIAILGKRRLIVAALHKVVWSAVAEATAFWSGSSGIAILGKRRLIVAALQKVVWSAVAKPPLSGQVLPESRC
jgi:hypothetical protein